MSKAHFVPSLVSWFSELGLHSFSSLFVLALAETFLGGEEFLLCMQSMGGFERIKLRGYKEILKVETSLEEIIRMVKLKAASFHDLQLQQ